MILDSGAVTHLARTPQALARYRARLRAGETIVVPSAVLIECRAGDPRRDTAVSRLLKLISIDERLPNGLANKASMLRTRARRGSVVDALVVAYADPGGVVVTGDLKDLRALAQYARNVVIEGI